MTESDPQELAACRAVLSFRLEARETLAVKRRAFMPLLGGAAAWPVTAQAQQGEQIPINGGLRSSFVHSPIRVAEGRRGQASSLPSSVQHP
jgi:hypothetical protein